MSGREAGGSGPELVVHIAHAQHGTRLDAALGQLLEGYSRTTLSSFISGGRVSVDGQTITRPSFRVSEHAMVRVVPEVRAPAADRAQDLPLRIVYQDDDLLVINKPAGLVVHPGAGMPDGTLLNALLHHFPRTARLSRAGIVHRLDRDTTGLMVTALSETAQLRLSEAMAQHRVVREYEAVVHGLLVAGGTVRAGIGRDPRHRVRMAVMPEGMGRPAVTHYRVVEKFRAHTRLRLRLETGRTHQIRVHMASIRHPLLGDPEYGTRRPRPLRGAGAALAEALRTLHRQALHAAVLELEHPLSGEQLRFEAPLPDDMAALLALLREDYRIHGPDL